MANVNQMCVFGAVIEILQGISHKTNNSKHSAHVNVKSTKKHSETLSNLWFYIKVTTSAIVTKDIFQGLSESSPLYKTLVEMEAVEDESHLCIQYPHAFIAPQEMSESQGHTAEGGTRMGTLQQNLKLEGGVLTVHDETFKNKETQNSVLHLRVHTSLIEMLGCCKQIHNSMSLMRIFKPKARMTFSMKVGEVVSETDFSFEHWKTLTNSCNIVTDTNFLLHRSEWTPSEPSTIPYHSEPLILPFQVLTRDNLYKTVDLQVTSVGQYIRLNETGVSVVNLTILGPGHIPLNHDSVKEVHILEGVDWQKFDMKMSATTVIKADSLPYQIQMNVKPSKRNGEIDAFVILLFLILKPTDSGNCGMSEIEFLQNNVGCFMTTYKHRIVQCMENVLEKILQPVIARRKTRVLVTKCIDSACKALTDIVTLSTNEDFRNRVLDCMRVPDSVELHNELKNKLSSVSRRKHHAAWSTSSSNTCWRFTNQSTVSPSSSQECSNSQTVGCTLNVSSVCKETSGADSCISGSHPALEVNCDMQRDVMESNINVLGAFDFISKNKNNAAQIQTDVRNERLNTDNIKHTEQNFEQTFDLMPTKPLSFNNQENISEQCRTGVHLGKGNARTPDMIDHPEIPSPFHQLATTTPGVADTPVTSFETKAIPTPGISKITSFETEVTPTPGITRITATPEQAVKENDLTPDIVQLTHKMEGVSPFVDIAEEEEVDSKGQYDFHEDPFMSEMSLHDTSDDKMMKRIIAEHLHKQQLVNELNSHRNRKVTNELTAYKHDVSHIMEGVSPFHELAIDETEDCIVTKRNKETHSRNGNCGETFKDLTPEIVNISHAMKEVSPFLELAIDEKGEKCSTGNLHENPFVSKIDTYNQSDVEILKSKEFKPTYQIVSKLVDHLGDNTTKFVDHRGDNTRTLSLVDQLGDNTTKLVDHRGDDTRTLSLVDHLGDNTRTLADRLGDDTTKLVDHCGDQLDDKTRDTAYTSLPNRDWTFDQDKDCTGGDDTILGLERGQLQQEQDSDSDDWFEDVLMDVENWLH